MSLKNFVGHEIYSSFNKILLGHDLYIYWCIIKITFLNDILSFTSGDFFSTYSFGESSSIGRMPL